MKPSSYKFLLSGAFLLAVTILLGQSPTSAELTEGNEKQSSMTTTGINFGASYHTGFGGGSFISQSASPFIRHRISNRFSIFAGAELSLFQFSGRTLSLFPIIGTDLGSSQISSNNFWGISAFVGGEYKINNKLSLFGNTWIARNTIANVFHASSLEAVNNISRGISMNLEYRVSSNLSIGAGFSVSDRRNPIMLHDGFGNSRSPFMFGPIW